MLMRRLLYNGVYYVYIYLTRSHKVSANEFISLEFDASLWCITAFRY